MTGEDIYDLLGIFSYTIQDAEEKMEFYRLCADAFTEHIHGLHRAEFAVCRDPLCQAAFEMEILCDLYRDLND